MDKRGELDEKTRRDIVSFQRNEITEYHAYENLAKATKGQNGEVLAKFGEDELRHSVEWRKYTGEDVSQARLTVLKYLLFSKVFGLTFVVKIMERGEKRAEEVYTRILRVLPDVKGILDDEFEHERALEA